MKKSKLVLAALILGLTGCSSVGDFLTKDRHPPAVPVDCTGYLEMSALNRTYTVPLIEKREYEKSGKVMYRVGKGNPFHGQNWVYDHNLDYIKCD